VKPRTFFAAVLASALLWTGGYVILGSVFGKYWISIANTSGGIQKILGVAVGVTIVILIIRSIAQRRAKKKKAKSLPDTTA
jgi:membrane protein DedA with SNARE-associated domain